MGALPSSSPGEGAAEMPKGHVGGEGSFLPVTRPRLALLEGNYGILRWARPVHKPYLSSASHRPAQSSRMALVLN